jgi:hypothetical protein
MPLSSSKSCPDDGRPQPTVPLKQRGKDRFALTRVLGRLMSGANGHPDLLGGDNHSVQVRI